jgi:hypothetical protein
MKHKKIVGFFTGLILANIYFDIEDRKKIKQIKDEIEKSQNRNEQIINRYRNETINR